ncbi:hypothetical protein OPT61_g3466 [Boeremia exigua]|uniref:Uncharacterized protein n=1 Tax=Boeremia exigua TaxID=749465 RepID=A0ACC2IHS9_9PLEO|nr:hypothetical protein OPT61_g3466 [Boeremia exigua]
MFYRAKHEPGSKFVYAIFGVQYEGAEPTGRSRELFNDFDKLISGKAHLDRMKCPGKGDFGTIIWLSYWRPPQLVEWFASQPVSSFWKNLADDAGIWREFLTVDTGRAQNACTAKLTNGVNGLDQMESFSDHIGYWGCNRDRLPDSSPEEQFTGSIQEIPKQTPENGTIRPGRTIITGAPDNICFLVEGQDHSLMTEEEKKHWFAELDDLVTGWMLHLDDKSIENGILDVRMGYVPENGTFRTAGPINLDHNRKIELFYWLDMKRFERAGRVHHGHIKLRRKFMEAYSPAGCMGNGVGRTVLWEETSILKGKDIEADAAASLCVSPTASLYFGLGHERKLEGFGGTLQWGKSTLITLLVRFNKWQDHYRIAVYRGDEPSEESPGCISCSKEADIALWITSASDTESERMVQAAPMQATSSNKITTAVAHRLSTVRYAHRMTVFSDGRINDTRTHDDPFDETACIQHCAKFNTSTAEQPPFEQPLGRPCFNPKISVRMCNRDDEVFVIAKDVDHETKVDIFTTRTSCTNEVSTDNNGDVAVQEQWHYPVEISNDLKGVSLLSRVKEEVFATAWEYSRSVIPQYTNWSRYVAFIRIIIIGTIAEFRGELVDVVNNDDILGYNLEEVLDTLFKGTPGRITMAREFRCFLLVSSHKSRQADSILFSRYSLALSRGPYQYFRMRDTDALARFTIAAALACSDLDDFWLTDDQFDIVAEVGNTMYDAIAFWKHRAESETNNLFAYVPDDERVRAYHRCREALWALDVTWILQPEMQVVANFLRFFGGPIHMTMRRYRFVEEGLTLGKRENEAVIAQTRNNHKLWNRVHNTEGVPTEIMESMELYKNILSSQDVLLFEGLYEILEEKDEALCRCQSTCMMGGSYAFGGVQLCRQCREE